MMPKGLRRLLCGTLAVMMIGSASALADTATVTATKLMLREKASSASDALQTLPKGTTLEIIGTSGSWYKVTYGKYTGYVYKNYVKVTKTSSSSTTTTAKTTSSSSSPLEKGSTGSAVRDLQTKLKKLGFYTATVDGAFGETTEKAVKAFQKKYNLTADGVAGTATLKKLNSLYSAATKTSDSSSSSSASTDDGKMRIGSTGSAVKQVQTLLKQLGFYSGSIDGNFGSGTYKAVVAFQKKYGLTVDGVVGSATLKKLQNASSSSSSSSSSTAKNDDRLENGAIGTKVKTLQTNLKKLGFYTASVDGSFGTATENAVRAFQKKYGLTVDGVAGSATLAKIEEALKSGSTTSTTYTTERLDWFNGGKNVIPSGATFQVKDVSTGLVFSAKEQSCGNHLDAEPLTAEDTAILKKINGGSFSWRRRAVLVKYNGHVYAASIYSEPHGDNTILDNNFDGQFCLHFYGSKTNGTNRVDEDHQKCVEQAMKATW